MNMSSNSSLPTAISPWVPVVKFIFGFLTTSLFTIVLSSLPFCKTLVHSSKIFLMMFYSLNLLSYSLMTFYSPFVALGLILIKNQAMINIVAFYYQVSAFGLHITQGVLGVDRLVALRFSTKQDVLFSRKRTKLLILFIIVYATVLSSSSFLHCCAIVYNPTMQVWYYPNDEETHYRTYLGISLNGNGVLLLIIYSYIIYYINKRKRQIANETVQRQMFKKEITLCVIFAFPLVIGTFYSVSNIIMELFPKFAQQTSVEQLNEFTRYIYIIEPILTITLLQEVRDVLKQRWNRFMKACRIKINSGGISGDINIRTVDTNFIV